MQSPIRYSEEGLFIPSEWLKDMGADVSVQKSGNVIIIEARQRQAARRQLKNMVQRLRRTGRELEPLPDDELASLINEVRERHASDH